MASSRPDDSDSDVRVYITDTIVDNPGAEIVDKGRIICNYVTLLLYKRENPDFAARMRTVDPSCMNFVAQLTEWAKEKAKKLGANAIVGMKISYSKSVGLGDCLIGTAVRYTPKI